MGEALARIESGAPTELSVRDVVNQVAKIQDVMKQCMKDGEHYGKIPGCGEKPALLKPGAEKLGFMFRLAPRFSGETPIDLGNGHREYIIRCELEHIGTGQFVGSGVGSCSTMESKYRYRTGPKEFTGKPVPREYWDLRESNPSKAKELIGGPGHTVGKNESGQWEICLQGDRIEHPDPADHYNTVLKMAKKRAHVDAVITATAASDFFTQDIEDMVQNDVAAVKSQNGTKPVLLTSEPSNTPSPISVPQIQAPICDECQKTMQYNERKNDKTGKLSQWWACPDYRFNHQTKQGNGHSMYWAAEWKKQVESMGHPE